MLIALTYAQVRALVAALDAFRDAAHGVPEAIGIYTHESTTYARIVRGRVVRTFNLDDASEHPRPRLHSVRSDRHPHNGGAA